jgi:hypothetical protein
MEFDANNNPVTVTGFNAGRGWDAPTGLGTPTGTQLVNRLIQLVRSDDGQGAIGGSDPDGSGNHSGPGHNRPN